MSIIKDKLRILIRNHNQKNKLDYDIVKYAKYFADSADSYKASTYYEREILVLSHTIEKGLSHKALKPRFGENSVKQLSHSISEYLKNDEVDKFVVSLGINALNEYIRVHSEAGIDISDYNIVIPDVPTEIVDAGANEVQIGDFFSKNKDDFDIFSKSRHSMRLYDSSGLQIERDVLEKCIRSSMNAPSACNRQAVRILVVDNKKIIKKISEIQKGATGFGENSSALILVLSDIRYYVTAERRLPMFDCGLFSMNLLYNFHYNGLGACILNGSFTEEQEKDLMNIIDIPDYEMLACVIAVSKINHNETIRIAKSARRNAKDIYRFIEG